MRAGNRFDGSRSLERMGDPTDHPTTILPLDAAHIRPQMRSDRSPLLVAQPKEGLAHSPDPVAKTNQDPVVEPPSGTFVHG
jgi:hypothetical protein